MRLRSLRIRRLPGIDPGFEVPDVAPGINVVIGPNASGKSSVLRAVRALLYPEELKRAQVDVEATFQDEGGPLHATRVGDAVRWSRDGVRVAAPELPPHHLLACYTVGVEDLAALSGTDQEIARQLGLELLGGYDLEAVRTSGARKPPGAGRSEADKLRHAEDRLREVLRDHAELQRQQAAVAGKRRDLEEAKAAAEEAAAHRRALALLEVERELRGLRERLAGFPEGMDRLRGDEAERLDALRGRRQEAEQRLQAARARHSEAARALAESGLQESALTSAEIEEYRALLHSLHRSEADAEALAAEASKAGARLREAEDQLQAPPEPEAGGAERPAPPSGSRGARLDPRTLGRVEDSLATRRSADAERRSLARELDTLPEPDAATGSPQDDVERLREGRRSLTAYLSAARTRRWDWAAVLGLVLAVTGTGSAIALAALQGSEAARLAAAGVVAATGIALLARGGTGSARRSAGARYRETGLELPAAWDADAVRARLDRLDEDLLRALRLRDGLARRLDVERRLAEVERALDESAERLAEVAARVGFDPRHLDADFHRWLRLVDSADRARAEHAEVQAELARKRQAAARLEARLRSFLAAHGEAPASREGGADALRPRLEGLARRMAEREQAVTELRAADTDIARAEAERARQEEEIVALFADAGLAARAPGAGEADRRALATALHDRLERLSAFEGLRDRLRDAEVLRLERARELGDRDDLRALVGDDAEATLRDAAESLERTAARREELADEITRTQTLIARAERERTLERARAERRDAADALADLVAATLQAEAGRFLIDRIEAEHEQRSRPPALRRAEEWFRRFTRNRFELDYDAAREPPFAAVDTGNRERRLPGELSTGTRAQMLLAVRVAFAVEAEGGRSSLPLFLDEALTTADAERFRAVADALGLLARDGDRQLFYLTARPEDAALWRRPPGSAGASPEGPGAHGEAPHIIDVALLRRDAQAAARPELLAVEEAPAIPAPDGHTPEQYAALLGVPALDPWQPADACHPFHLLRDRPALVQRLLEAGVSHVGAVRSLLRSAAAAALLSDAERACLVRRVRALEVFLEGWRRGLGRPVDRAALEASGAVSDTFLGRVERLAQAVDGDAEALLRGLERGDVARFRSRDRDALEAWLSQHDYLDDRAPLDASELRLRLVEALVDRHADPRRGDPTRAGEGGGYGRSGDDAAGARRPVEAGPDGQDGPRPDAGRQGLREARQLLDWLAAAVRAGPAAGDAEPSSRAHPSGSSAQDPPSG